MSYVESERKENVKKEVKKDIKDVGERDKC